VACQNPLIPGVVYDGGYADYVVVPAEALVAIPDTLKSVDAAQSPRTRLRFWVWAAWGI
jgi:D-arabinose 1-dehydrogenase-like Zn-dependent alcohol dehydrogenase